MVYNEILKREIPDGWDVSQLGELIHFERGISYKSKEITNDGIPMINLNSFDLSGKYKNSGLKYFSGAYKEQKVVYTDDLVIAITDVTRNADIIGKAFSIPTLFDDYILISCDVAKIIPSDLIDKEILEFLFNSKHYHNHIKYFASGTIVLHLNLDGVKWYKIPLPPKNVLDSFSQIRKSIKKKITLSIKENQKLESLRDWLLPMLMNGQVTVSDKLNNETIQTLNDS
jgi:type I restriction enzyme S subunit